MGALFKNKNYVLLVVVFTFIYGSTTSIDHVVIFSALQMVSFPFLLISQKELILNESPEHLRSSGQMVAVAFTSGFSSIISPILAGYLGEYFALNLVLIGMGLFMSVPILLMSFYKLKNIT